MNWAVVVRKVQIPGKFQTDHLLGFTASEVGWDGVEGERALV